MHSMKFKAILGSFFLFVCLCFPTAGFADGIVCNMRNDVQPVASLSNDLSYASGTAARRANELYIGITSRYLFLIPIVL